MSQPGVRGWPRLAPALTHGGHFRFQEARQVKDGGASGASLGLGLLIAMVTAALAIAIIALLISKMRRRQNTDSTDIELEVPTDPYMEAIMFPTEPRPEWHRHLRQVLNKAGQKIFKKSESHDTTIPENLRHQLKHIYVY
ncbi:uncharacterized protein LOC126982878 isoform X4 [Eriocheir sinensis]|uniref:uncharacterized protein LOC126982878 isoform X4 n=1 Tax=Eriocheir sinensis TaxID=95602 RepID=UPI0021C9DA84|nr:uncharacterized protein LOC126982878 isoform X4 [Eriocheir sinensis]